MTGNARPVAVAIQDDFEVIVEGLAAVLAPHDDLVRVVDLQTAPDLPDERPEVVLVDTFAQPDAFLTQVRRILDEVAAPHVAIYTWDFAPELIALARRHGVSGYLPKSLPGRELASVLFRIRRGEVVFYDSPVPDSGGSGDRADEYRWPGDDWGLSERESEVLVLAGRGLSNREMAERLHVSVNTVKTHLHHAYQRTGVGNRAAAANFVRANRFDERWWAEQADPR